MAKRRGSKAARPQPSYRDPDANRSRPVPNSPTLIVAGCLMLALGIGNWTMGSIKLAQYGSRMAAAVAEGGPEVRRPFRGTESILERRTDAHELYTKSLIKREQYRVVHRGGRMLTLLGSAFILIALARRRFSWAQVYLRT